MSDALLPREFAELEPWAATWCLATEPERWAQRMRSSMAELQAFYDAFFPRAEEAIAWCAAVNDLGYGQTMELLGMTQFTPIGGGMKPLDRAWNDPDLWKKG